MKSSNSLSVPNSGLFSPGFKPASMTVQSLEADAELSNRIILQGIRSSGSAELDKEVIRKTLEEKEAGWLLGPVDPKSLPEGSIVSRRFGLQQPGKVRLIDDFSASNVNSTVQTTETPKPHSTDVIASLGVALLESFPNMLMLGRTFDLKAAYRQLGVRLSSLKYSYIACFDPYSGGPLVFQMLAVPFGASRSVYSFLRIVNSLWWLGCRCLGLQWTNHYDDFVYFLPKNLHLAQKLR